MFEEKVAAMNAETAAVLPSSGFEKRVYTVDEIQDILQISKTTAYNLVNSGVFHSVRIAVSIVSRSAASTHGLTSRTAVPPIVKCAIDKIAY